MKHFSISDSAQWETVISAHVIPLEKVPRPLVILNNSLQTRGLL